MSLSNKELAILDLLAYSEGTLGRSQNGYDVVFGYRVIVGWNENSTIAHGLNNWVSSGSVVSSAAGRYQFIAKTWVGINNGVNVPLSKTNQDNAAIRKIKERLGGLSINDIDGRDYFYNVLQALAPEWASIPLTKTITVGGKTRYRGKSYYDGENGNGAKGTPEKYFEIYSTALKLYNNQ